ncbi:MAG: ATP-binding protein [Pseudomonas sp.]|uniref:ATP-binding protein n=1 Tax=Pseudomonas sp. TaxID=306 RepID=UPI003D6F52BE
MDSYPAKLFSALVDQIEMGIVVLDADLCIQGWNDYISQRSGSDLEGAIGRPFIEVFPSTDSESFAGMVDMARKRGKHIYNHWLQRAPLVRLNPKEEGDKQPLQSTLFFPFEESSGQRSYGLVMYDTSTVAQSNKYLDAALTALANEQHEQTQLLHQLETASSQLLQSEKLAAIGQLAAGVAHEINNPIGYVFSNLNSLSGYVNDLLKIIDAVDEVGSLDELRQIKRSLEYDYIRSDVGELISESEDGLDRVKRIIGALKDFSYIDEEEFRPADLHRGLETTLNVVNNELKYKAEVVKEYGELPELECILSQVNQVVMNLLVNAAHAIEQFGRITLRTGCDQTYVWFEVEDSGAGIDPKVLNRIFEPFFTTKPVGKGTGLGLALSYNIVQKHNGRIEVRSEAGAGATFRVYLPIFQPSKKPLPGTPK